MTHHNRTRLLCIPAVLTAVLLAFSAAPERATGAETIYIIANNSIAAASLSMAEARLIFQKEKTRLGSSAVMPIHARKDSSLRADFAARVLNMSVQEEIGYWEAQKVQSGKQPPAELGDTVKAVFSMKSGISYCYASQYRSGVAKILLKI